MTAATLNFKEKIVLEDERVKLRPLELTDFDSLLPFALTESELWKYSSINASGKEGLKNYLQLAINGRISEKEFPFIVFDKKINRYAGCTRFYDIQLQNSCLQLGYTWYGKEFQGTGLNKHCKYLLLQFAFEKMKIERVEFRADNNNLKSIAAMKSIGCTIEGILRSNGLTSNGTRRDSIVLSILKREWENDVKENLKKYLGNRVMS